MKYFYKIFYIYIFICIFVSKIIKKMKHLIFTFLFFISGFVLFAQNQNYPTSGNENPSSRSIYVEIIQNNDQSNIGKIIEQNDNSILILLNDETQVKYNKENIKEINPLELKVETNAGIIFQGFCTKENNYEIWLKGSDDTEYQIKKSQIKTIQILKKDNDRYNPYEVVDNIPNSKSADVGENSNIAKSLKSEYPMVGLTLLLPGGLNLIGGYHYDKFAAFGEIGFLPQVAFGFQVEFLYNLKTARHFEHNLGIGAGLSVISQNDSWAYLGIFYNLNLYGFFLEPGITIGSGNAPNPQLWFQFGYVYRFNK